MANQNRVAADGNNRIAADGNNRVTPEVIPPIGDAQYGREVDVTAAGRSVVVTAAGRST